MARGGVSRLQARGGPLLEGGGQRLAALVANLVAAERKLLEPRRRPAREDLRQLRRLRVAPAEAEVVQLGRLAKLLLEGGLVQPLHERLVVPCRW